MTDPQQSGYSNDPSWQAQPPASSGGYPDQAYQPAPQSPPGYPDPVYQQGYSADQGYQAPGYPSGGDPNAAGQPPMAGYPPHGYPVVVASPPTNGLSIAALVVAVVGALGICGYGLGGYIGIVGAILGHVSRKQIRERGESGEGLATAGIIVGWIAGGIAILATLAIVGFAIVVSQQPSNSGY
jgi:hypothetical protein